MLRLTLRDSCFGVFTVPGSPFVRSVPLSGKFLSLCKLFAKTFPALIAEWMSGHMLRLVDAFEVVNGVVARVSVSVVDNVIGRNRAVVLLPDFPVQGFDATLDVAAAGLVVVAV